MLLATPYCKMYDVSVIGLGTVRSFACSELAPRGVRVIAVDRFTLPYGQGSHSGDTHESSATSRVSISGCTGTTQTGLRKPIHGGRAKWIGHRAPRKSISKVEAGFKPALVSDLRRAPLSDEGAASLCTIIGCQPSQAIIPWRFNSRDLGHYSAKLLITSPSRPIFQPLEFQNSLLQRRGEQLFH